MGKIVYLYFMAYRMIASLGDAGYYNINPNLNEVQNWRTYFPSKWRVSYHDKSDEIFEMVGKGFIFQNNQINPTEEVLDKKKVIEAGKEIVKKNSYKKIS